MTSPTTPPTTPPIVERRRWLLRSGATLAGALGAGNVGNLLLGAREARAQSSGYKALVCIFLYGGNDGMNMIVPADTAGHAAYAGVRGGLALPRASLVGFNASYGLHPQMTALAPVIAQGQLAPVFNVGPLRQPLTKAQYTAAVPGTIPDSLFSHSDQQNLWENGTHSIMERTGWGGRASTAMATVNPVISVGGTARFGSSALQSPLVLPGPGATFGAYGLQPSDLTWAPNALRKTAIDALYAQSQGSELADAYTRMQRDAFAMSQRLAALVKVQPGDAGASVALNTAFAPLIVNGAVTTGLGQQLYQIAKLIEANATVQGNRQIFFAQMGGFDMHSEQAVTGSPAEGAHGRKMKELADALACFHAAVKAIGLGPSVTAFTQSDFGRTFKPNSSNGTDHAWGNQQLVIGGAVRAGTYGRYPTLALGSADDVGTQSWELQGRWIPSTSVDQYAATLLGWFGASDAQLDLVLPNLTNFAVRRLGFL